MVGFRRIRIFNRFPFGLNLLCLWFLSQLDNFILIVWYLLRLLVLIQVIHRIYFVPLRFGQTLPGLISRLRDGILLLVPIAENIFDGLRIIRPREIIDEHHIFFTLLRGYRGILQVLFHSTFLQTKILLFLREDSLGIHLLFEILTVRLPIIISLTVWIGKRSQREWIRIETLRWLVVTKSAYWTDSIITCTHSLLFGDLI